MRIQNKGFTLLEILLVIAAIGILAAIVLVAINPTKQIESARSAQRKSEINSITKAIQQYSIDNKGQYPVGIETGAKPICNTGSLQTGGPSCTGFVDLKVLVPTYIASIPQSDSNNYYVRRSNNNIEVSHPRDSIWNIGGTPSLDLNFAKNKSLIDGVSGNNLISFARNSTATYIGEDGLIKTAAANEARFDHNPATGESLGLLVEEQRTNLLAASEAADASPWGLAAATVVANNGVAPDGTTTADKIISTGGGNYRAGVGVTNATAYTYSVFLKHVAGTGVISTVGFEKFGSTPLAGNSSFNLLTGTVVSNGADVQTSTITPYPNNWFRVSVTATSTNVTTAVTNYTGVSGNEFLVWGAQLEAGAFATSYIPTTSAAVTRSADVASITGSAFSSWYRQDEGTVLITQRNNPANLSGTVVEIGGTAGNYGLGHTAHRISFANATTLDTRSYFFGSGTPSGFFYGNRTSPGTIAYTYKQSNYGLSTGGNNVPMNAGSWDQLVPVVDSYLGLGRIRDGSSTTQLHIARLTYWPTRLSNTVLQSITQ